MSGSRLPDGGTGAMPRKVAELLRSHEEVHESLLRLFSLVKLRGANARMIERVVVGSPRCVSMTVALLELGLCGEAGVAYPDLASALKQADLASVWRAALVANMTEFVTESIAGTGLATEKFYASAWASAETAYWVATRHVVDPDEAFMTALLLDVGLVSLAHSLPEVYKAFAASGDSRPIDLFELESFGFDHCAVGTAVLRVYKFPDDLSSQVLDHHAPSQSLDMFGKVLRAASVAVASEGGDCGLGTQAPRLDLPLLEGALLKASDESELRSRSRASLEAALSFSPASTFRAA